MHFHDKDAVVTYLDEATLKSTPQTGKPERSDITFGLVKVNARDRIHSEEVVKGSLRAIIVEFK